MVRKASANFYDVGTRLAMKLGGPLLACLVFATTGATVTARIPVPTSYSQTCELVRSWCTPPVPGSLPPELQRPLHLPKLEPGQPCPVSHGRLFSNSQFGGFVLGVGLVQPLIVGPHAASFAVMTFRAVYGRGWYAVKTLWFGRPSYQGPVLIRGRRLDAPGRIVFGGTPSVLDPQLPPEPTLNGTGGWREWPGGTWLRSPGCYAWQIDGTDFSTVIVFKAVFVR
jgi:hypothetical protein